MQPRLYIIAGCNGAGKTTASYSMLPDILQCREFVNADEIARGLSPFRPEQMAIPRRQTDAPTYRSLAGCQRDICRGDHSRHKELHYAHKESPAARLQHSADILLAVITGTGDTACGEARQRGRTSHPHRCDKEKIPQRHRKPPLNIHAYSGYMDIN